MAKGIDLQPAYVLHRRPYRDTSALIETFTLDYGRVGVVARGIHKGRAPRAGILQPFRPVLLSWSGRGELGTLTGAEPGASTSIPERRRVFSGFYVNELVMRLLPRQAPHRGLFARYAATLEGLARGTDEALVLRRFEKALLEAAGYGLELWQEADTGAEVDPRARYVCPADVGPLRWTPGHRAGGPLVSGSTLLALHRGEHIEPSCLVEARDLMRALLAPHLGDRPLHSRRMYASYLRSGA
jgi:DNA repair protein RecO (recombination protein O)